MSEAIADWVIDTDTHITEPPDTFSARLPAKHRDRAPKIVRNEETGNDIWIAPVDGSREPVAVVDSPGADELPRLSRDGSLLAYTSNETGRFEVYVRPFPSGTGRWQVSNDGGNYPRWSSSSSAWMESAVAANACPIPATAKP